jgi:hypothetical protein
MRVKVCVCVCVCMCIYFFYSMSVGPVKFRNIIPEIFEVGSYFMVDPKLFEEFHGLSKPYSRVCSGNSVFVTNTLAPDVVRISGMVTVPKRGSFMLLQPLVQAKVMFEKHPPFHVTKHFKQFQEFSEDHYPNALILWTDFMIFISMNSAKHLLLDQVFVSIHGTHFSDKEASGESSLDKKLLHKHQPRFPLSFIFQSKFLLLINL